MRASVFLALALATQGAALPAAAQEIAIGDTVFAGDYLAVGLGAAATPSYAGSDDYTISPVPLLRGSIGGVDINPRGAGLNFDFLPDGEGRVSLDLGASVRLRSDRASQIEDPLVESLGRLDRAIEVGPSAGVSFARVTNPYDALSLSVDVLFDVNGAHGGAVVSPSVSYFTPLSRSTAALFTLGSEWADARVQRYYFRITPEQSAATGGALPAFATDGAGFAKGSATLLLAYDLNGDLADGGWGLFGLLGYSRMLGDGADTPFTRVAGSTDQMLGAFGLGYTF